MANAEESNEWDDAYGGPPPPWDIGRPQGSVARLADAGALTGDLLDVGCGTGEHTILAARHGARALGVDLSPRAVATARAKAAERGVGARFQVHDALSLDRLGETFDTVIDSGLFHVFDDTDCARYVASLHSVLRTGGHLYLLCFSDDEPGDWGPRRVSERELRDAFATGWRVEELTRVSFAINPGRGTPSVVAWLAHVVRT